MSVLSDRGLSWCFSDVFRTVHEISGNPEEEMEKPCSLPVSIGC